MKHLYSIGSILGFGCQDATVWGSGLLYPYEMYLTRMKMAKLDVRSVRGPKTRSELLKMGIQCPEVYGDPAILMPEIYKPEVNGKEYAYSLIKHISENDTLYPIHKIDMHTTNYRYVIDEIMKSEIIISSSLHGIILAEAYGVPAILYKPIESNLFKFEDYYESTGRQLSVIARTIEDGKKLTPMKLPDFSKMKKQIKEVFPYDLWKS